MQNDRLIIAGHEFTSRLFVGTGKYKDFVETKKAIEASGADVVTVAVRRVNITDRSKENLLDYLDPKKYTILPNTAGCYNVEDAVRYARLARAAGVSDLIKLEVLGDERTLFPYPTLFRSTIKPSLTRIFAASINPAVSGKRVRSSPRDRKSTRLNSSHGKLSRMPSSA